LADSPEAQNKPKSQQGSRKKAALVVALVSVGAVAAILVMNGGRLTVDSAVADPAPVEEEEQEAPAPNHAPVIVGLTAATDRITPFDLCVIECEAIDEDGGPLTYTWFSDHGDVYGEGAAIEWGAPDSEGLFRLSVTVDDGRGGTAEFSTSLRVKTNYAPEILSMTSNVDWVVPEASCYISCVAEDDDGDTISYEWTATGGEFFGEGSAVIWVAPETAESYWITVWARDIYGGESMHAMPINATFAEPPHLGEFVLTPNDTDMLKRKGDAWAIFRGRSCTIECVVEEGHGPFTYEWSVDQGKLKANGAAATWEAPGTRISATIVVTVSDTHGNEATGSVLIYVETCTCAF